MFKFTFNSGSGIFNPFVAKAEEQERIQQSVAPQTITRKLPAPPKRPVPSPSIADDVQQPSRKRGWAPTSSSASAAASQPTLTNGWIDTPSRYLEAASQSHRGVGEDEAVDADLPPTKRRKTLTDTIISTAFSAALIGTAVGMTAYRMWRDRGKPTGDVPSEPMEPPPPYEREEWVNDVPQSKPISRPPRLPRKPRSVARRTPRRRMAPIVTSPPRSPIRVPSPSRFTSFQPEEVRDNEDGLDHQIDWMGDRIRSLIEEGQRALGKEVVVMNDDEESEEGAVDDGMDGWEEESNQPVGPSSPMSSSYSQSRRRLPKTLGIDPPVSPPNLFNPAFPTSPSRTSTSPSVKRSRTSTSGKRAQGSSSTLANLSLPRSARLGNGTSDGTEDIKVIYEPPPVIPNHQIDSKFQDEDSRGLAERMENIRKAYRIR